MNKIIYTLIVVAITVIISLGGYKYLENRKIIIPVPECVEINCAEQSRQKTSELLVGLNQEMRKTGASVETINNYFVDKFGPCWGIPDGECQE
jgi:hypothetical protein